MAENTLRVAPDVCSCVDENHTPLTVEIALPGVKKADIDLRIHDDVLTLRATREGFEYTSTLAFCCIIIPEQAKAEYNNGLLKLVAPFRDPMDGAVELAIGGLAE